MEPISWLNSVKSWITSSQKATGMDRDSGICTAGPGYRVMWLTIDESEIG